MASFTPARPARRAWLIVLLLHGLAGWLLSQRLAPPAAARRPALVSVWLPPMHLPPPTPKQAPARARLPAVDGRSLPPDPAPAAVAAPPAPATEESPQATRSSVAPLMLGLPATISPPASAAWRNPALADERSNSPRANVEQRIARAIGGEPDQPDEIHSPTRRRIRYRGGCYDVQQSRDAQLDPFNASVKQAPAQLKPCSW
jgi:hypothetical protein